MHKSRVTLKRALTLLPFFVFVTAFLLLPLFRVVVDSFRLESGQWSLANYRAIFENPFFTQSFANSIEISLKSTAIGLFIAVVAAHAIHGLEVSKSRRVLSLINMASNFSGVPLAFAFMIILGNNGFFTTLFRGLSGSDAVPFDLYSKTGLLAVYVYFQIPLGILLMVPAMDRIEGGLLAAAETLGAKKSYFWAKIGLPMLAPAILSTGTVLFANAMGAYATAYALTSGAFNIVPVRIGTLVSGDIFLKPNMASALAVVLAVILLVLNSIGRRKNYEKE